MSVALSSVSSRTTVSSNSPLSVAVGYGVFVRINVAVIQIFKCVHGFHPFPCQTPYHSPFRKSSTFQNKNDFLQNRLFFRRKSDIITRYIMSKEDLTMANGNATIIVGSARLGSARQEHSAVFSACQVLFHTIYNEPVAGDRAHYALASAFCVCRKDGGLILKS